MLDRVFPTAENFEIRMPQINWPRGDMIWFQDGKVVMAKEGPIWFSAEELYELTESVYKQTEIRALH